MQKNIGERLLELRTQKQMTQEELAEQLKVTRQSVSKWESNDTFPNMNKLIEICDIFQVSLDYLLRGIEEPDINSKREQAKASAAEATVEYQEEGKAEETSEKIEKTGETSEEIGKTEEIRHGSLYIKLCMILVGILIMISGYMLVSLLVNHSWNANGRNQDLLHVDTVYEQYTKAKVSVLTEDGTNAERILWLDVDGVSENDWVFCYTDKGQDIKVKYMGRTFLMSGIAAAVFVLIFILLLMELRREYASKKK